MKTKLRVVLPVLFAGLSMFGCGDDGDGNNDPDSGTDVDGGVAGTVTVLAYSNPDGPPVVDLSVAFNNPDGSLLGVEVTDGSGMASRDDVLPGSSVTIIPRQAAGVGGGLGPRILTAMGVSPGDTVQFGSPTLTFPADVAELKSDFSDDYDSYQLSIGCASNGASTPASTVQLDVTDECKTTLDALLLGKSAGGGVVASGVAENQSITLGVLNDISTSAWEFASKTNVGYANLPAGAVVNLSAEYLHGGVTFGSGTVALDAGGSGIIANLAGSFDDTWVLELYIELAAGGRMAMFDYQPATASAVNRDYAAYSLAPIHSAGATLDGNRVSVSYTPSAAHGNADAGVVSIYWLPNGSIDNGVWTIYTPPSTAGELVTPVLPEDFQGRAPASDSTELAAEVRLWDSADASYDYGAFLQTTPVRESRGFHCPRGSNCVEAISPFVN